MSPHVTLGDVESLVVGPLGADYETIDDFTRFVAERLHYRYRASLAQAG